MVNSKLKNIIVLKGMASNVVQEAIVILKPNITLEKNNSMDKNKENVLGDRKKCIVQEAEYVIQNYINQIENSNKKISEDRLKKKYKISWAINIFLIISLIISIF